MKAVECDWFILKLAFFSEERPFQSRKFISEAAWVMISVKKRRKNASRSEKLSAIVQKKVSEASVKEAPQSKPIEVLMLIRLAKKG